MDVVTFSLSFLISGVNETIPLILNIIFASFTILLVYMIARRYKIKQYYTFVILLSTIIFTPFPALVFAGMEHMLHTFMTISFVFLATQAILKSERDKNKLCLMLVLTPLLTMARYESLFLVFATCILLAARKRLVLSLSLGMLAMAPIAIYGLISLSNGYYFLPNSILLKSKLPKLSLTSIGNFLYEVLRNAISNIKSSPHVFILVVLASFLLILLLHEQKTFWEDSIVMLTIFIITTFLHVLFANTGHFFRYEAYLVALGIVVIAIGLLKYSWRVRAHNCVMAFIIFLALLILANRGVTSLIITPQATTNIYQQQYQMGLFLRQFYQGDSIAANDIGAINFLSDIRCLDLWGLGSLEVAKAKIEGKYNAQLIYNLSQQKKVKIAIVYEHWFKEYGGLPAQWIKVGEWRIPNNVICGGDTVAFYAVDPTEESRLIENLRNFSSRLPRDVKQHGKYVNTNDEWRQTQRVSFREGPLIMSLRFSKGLNVEYGLKKFVHVNSEAPYVIWHGVSR